MNIKICDNVQDMGRQAAADAAERIRAAIRERGAANIVVATGASQFEVLAALVADKEIDWPKVTGFHLDEYLGLPMSHPASFRRYLKERFVQNVPLRAFHYVDGEADPQAECRRLGKLIAEHPIDVALVGIGENCHLAFNDPPADFDTDEPFIVVELDDACRQQQFGEGWFPTFDAVPTRAISMSIRQIMKSAAIVCSVPDRRKAAAVRAAIEGEVKPQAPASILQRHSCATIYLDPPAVELLASAM
jgi:glucosamine-6-phosphate deaminase